MKRKIGFGFLAILTALCFCFGLAACNSKGNDGEDGKDGKSAYEIWLENGHQGSEEDFLNWLKGEDGVDATACEHTYSGWEIGLAPTCTSIGYDIRTCTKCEDEDYRFIEETGHDWDAGHVLVSLACETDGETLYACLVCGTAKLETQPAEHNYQDGKCLNCGKPKPSEGLLFAPIYDKNSTIIAYAVNGIGDCKDTDIVISETYNGKPVTSIGKDAFENCSGLTNIVIPDSVTSIGECAFAECSGLTNVTIGNSVTEIGWGAFRYCGGLTSITIPDSVTSIGGEAFSGCNLTSVTIPDSVTSIGDYAFSGNYRLASIEVSSGNKIYRSEENCLIEIESGTLILGCKNSVIPDSVTSIGKAAFRYCGFTSIVIPDSVTSIGDWAFFACTELTSIVIPDSVTSIGGAAFAECSGLTSIVIPDSVTFIGTQAFSGNRRLASIEVSSGNKIYRSEGNCLIEIESGTLILGCKNSVIPHSVTSIGRYAFENCYDLTNIVIPDSVTSIGWGAFYGCNGLTSIVIPDSVTEIDRAAFYRCDSLTSVTFQNPNGWWISESAEATSDTNLSSDDLSNPTTAAISLTDTYDSYYWRRG